MSTTGEWREIIKLAAKAFVAIIGSHEFIRGVEAGDGKASNIFFRDKRMALFTKLMLSEEEVS